MFRIDLIKAGIILGMLLWLIPAAYAFQQLKGKVADEAGRGISYATIRFGQQGIVTDQDGNFSVQISEDTRELIVSAMGFETTTFPLSELFSGIVLKIKTQEKHLSEVVVTGSFEPQSARQSTFAVRSIDRETIQRRAASNLQEVLNTQLGIRFSQDNALGSSNLEMMGLSGQNVKILIDGVPMVGRQGVNNEINLNQIDINQIEKVEIVEGPMSVIYGADALAGVINIITKSPQSRKGYSLQARIQEETVGNSYNILQGQGNHIKSLQGTFRPNEKLGFKAGVTQNSFGGWKGGLTNRQFMWLPKDQILANGAITYALDKFDLDYSLDILNESITSYGPENRLEVIDANFITNRMMHRFNSRWEWKPNFRISLQSAFTDFNRRTATWVTNVRTSERNLSRQTGSQARLDYQGLTLRILGNWQLSPKLDLVPGVDLNTEQGVGDRISQNRGIQDYAVFLTGEWRPIAAVQLKPGLRKAYNSAYDPPALIPSLNTKISFSPTLDLRLAYANGFRAPSIRELYFDFFDASHSIRGNPDLVAETSNSFNASLSYQQLDEKGLKITFSGFFNDVNNRIAYSMDPEDPRITTLFNIEKFKTQGLMINAGIGAKRWKAETGFSYIGRFNQLSQNIGELPVMLYSPEVNSSVTYTVPLIEVDLNVFYKWTGAMPAFIAMAGTDGAAAAQEAMLDDFHWMDLTLSKRIGKGLSVNAGARNVFNVTSIQNTGTTGSAHGGGGLQPIGYGRSYFLGINYQISK
jgi:outer membrane receptor for ferrienterochelin and colicins